MLDAIAAIQAAMEATQKLRQLNKKINDVEMKMLLADLNDNLADAKLEMVELKNQLSTALLKNQELQSQVDMKQGGQPSYSDSAYVFEGDDGKYCTACWDTKTQKVRLAELGSQFRFAGKYRCPSCKATM